MGIQKGEIFKNRYYTRNLSEKLFNERKEQLKKLLKKLKF